MASRTVVRLLLDELEQLGALAHYRIQDNSQGVRIVHKKSRTRLSVIPCTSKGATGIVGSDFCLCDEPGSWPKNDGEILYSTLQSSLGKPGSKLKIIYVGTVAPSEFGFWPDLVASTGDPSVFIDRRQADPKKWHLASEIKRLNPLMWRFESSRRLLLRERDMALLDSRKKAAFLSFRMNRPSRDASDVLLTLPQWELILSRAVPERQGRRPFCGLDLGQHRSWSAVTFLWPNGRLQAHAFCPGIPPLAEQERRDSVAPGAYERLRRLGVLTVCSGWHRPPVQTIAELIRSVDPLVVFMDQNRLYELRDCWTAPRTVIAQKMGWDVWTRGINSLRSAASDGDLAVEQNSRFLIEESLRAATVIHSSAGGMRLEKRHRGKSRDDVCASLILASLAKATAPRAASWRYLGSVG